MQFITILLAAFAFGVAAKKKGREGLKWGAGLAMVLFAGSAAIGFYTKLAGDPMASWFWIFFVCIVAAISLFGLNPVAPTASAPSSGGGDSGAKETKACPFCAETIKAAAKVCKHCGRDLPEMHRESPLAVAKARAEESESFKRGAMPGEQKPKISLLKGVGVAIGIAWGAGMIYGLGSQLFNKVTTSGNGTMGGQPSPSKVSGDLPSYDPSSLRHLVPPMNARDGKLTDVIDLENKTDADVQSFIGIGNSFVGQERLRDAESAYLIAARLAAKLHGTNSIEAANALRPLTNIYSSACQLAWVDQKRASDAQECAVAESQLRWMVNLFEQKLGPNREETRTAREHLASLLDEMGRKNDAEQVRRQLIALPKDAQLERVAEEREPKASPVNTMPSPGQATSTMRPTAPVAPETPSKREADRSQETVRDQPARTEKSLSASWNGSWSGVFSCGPSNVQSRANQGGVSSKGDMVVVGGEARWSERSSKVAHVATGKVTAAGTVSLVGGGKWIDEESRKWRTTFEGQFEGERFTARGSIGSADGAQKFRDCTLDLRRGP